MNYVCGFMIDLEDNVLLILKNRPAFQAGKWNGIGGKIEGIETPHAAMVREFKEECGVDTLEVDWELTIELAGVDFSVSYFRTFVNKLPPYETVTDEFVAPHNLKDLHKINMLDNARWIVPMQFSRNIAFPIHVWWDRTP